MDLLGFYKEMVRPRRDKFKYPVCVFTENANYVASLNIAKENIEEKLKNRFKADIEKLQTLLAMKKEDA